MARPALDTHLAALREQIADPRNRVLPVRRDVLEHLLGSEAMLRDIERRLGARQAAEPAGPAASPGRRDEGDGAGPGRSE